MSLPWHQQKALESLKKDMKQAKRMIASLKKKKGDSDDDEAEKPPDDAGNKFGSQIEKKQKKSE